MTAINQTIRRTAGYTIDQTILVVAIIAILITLIIGSVGWDLLTRASGTKLGSSLRQIEDANGTFFARSGMWPTTAVPAAKAIIALKSAAKAGASAEVQAKVKTDLLNGLKFDDEESPTVVRHNFGDGGDVTETTATLNGQNYIMMTLTNVPLTETKEADITIDKTEDAAAGRLQYTVAGNTATVKYYANAIN